MPSLNDAKQLLHKTVKDEKIRLHCLEVSTIMHETAKAVDEDVEKWSITGLVHDIDFQDLENIEEHGKAAAEILRQNGYSEEIITAVMSHNSEHTGIMRQAKMDYALSAADNVSGLIYAYALMKGGTIAGMDATGLKKKMKDKRFAANVRRDLITDVSVIMPLESFLETAIRAMQSIAKEIGLK